MQVAADKGAALGLDHLAVDQVRLVGVSGERTPEFGDVIVLEGIGLGREQHQVGIREGRIVDDDLRIARRVAQERILHDFVRTAQIEARISAEKEAEAARATPNAYGVAPLAETTITQSLAEGAMSVSSE